MSLSVLFRLYDEPGRPISSFRNFRLLANKCESRGEIKLLHQFSKSPFFSLLTLENEKVRGLTREREREGERECESVSERALFSPTHFQLCQRGKMAFSLMLFPSLFFISCCSTQTFFFPFFLSFILSKETFSS